MSPITGWVGWHLDFLLSGVSSPKFVTCYNNIKIDRALLMKN